MPSIFTKVVRTRSGSRSGQSTAQLKDQFIRDLTSEANGILKQLSDQFSQDLQSQAAQALQGLNGDDGSGGVAQLFATGTRYLASQPVTKVNQSVTDRSTEAQSAFRLSQSQALAEANQTIAKGDKSL